MCMIVCGAMWAVRIRLVVRSQAKAHLGSRVRDSDMKGDHNCHHSGRTMNDYIKYICTRSK